MCPLISVKAALNFGDAGSQLDTAASASGVATGASLEQILASVISTVLGLVGVAFFLMVLYGGFLWMTAGGKEEQIKKAKKLITNAVIGIAIVGMAYSIAYFVTLAIEAGPELAAPANDPGETGGPPIIE